MFCNNTLLLGQSLTKFAGQLEDLYQKWKKGAKVNTIDGVDALMVLDQFYYRCPREIKHLVKDRDPKTTKESANIG